MQTTTIKLAKLIKKCAFELVSEWDSRDTVTYYSASTRKDAKNICEETARGMNLEPLGEVVFILLSGNWHQSLDWADKQSED